MRERAVVIEIEPRRASVATLIGAVDAALSSELPGLSVGIALAAGDERRVPLERHCDADGRISLLLPGGAVPEAAVRIAMPAGARPSPRTIPALAALLSEERLGAVEVPVPSRFGVAVPGGPVLRASGVGSGKRRLRAIAVGLRSRASRGPVAPPPLGTLAAERAEHLRHRARSATLRARSDRNQHRYARERLQWRHERSRLLLAERRVGQSGGAARWAAWRARQAGHRAAAVPVLLGLAGRTLRSNARRARRFLADRRRKAAPAESE